MAKANPVGLNTANKLLDLGICYLQDAQELASKNDLLSAEKAARRGRSMVSTFIASVSGEDEEEEK